MRLSTGACISKGLRQKEVLVEPVIEGGPGGKMEHARRYIGLKECSQPYQGSICGLLY
jgi:hypothetical protein